MGPDLLMLQASSQDGDSERMAGKEFNGHGFFSLPTPPSPATTAQATMEGGGGFPQTVESQQVLQDQVQASGRADFKRLKHLYGASQSLCC